MQHADRQPRQKRIQRRVGDLAEGDGEHGVAGEREQGEVAAAGGGEGGEAEPGRRAEAQEHEGQAEQRAELVDDALQLRLAVQQRRQAEKARDRRRAGSDAASEERSGGERKGRIAFTMVDKDVAGPELPHRDDY